MTTRNLLILPVLVMPVSAGSLSGGSGSAAVAIPADIISGGGSVSAGGAGAGAVTNLGSVGAIAGTVASGSIVNRQGYIPQLLPPLTGYGLWALVNIPAGRDSAFGADWNGDGISNGVAYALGSTAVDADTTVNRFRIDYPATVPADVNLYLERSLDLTANSWLTIVSWENGAAPVGAPGIELQLRVRDPIRATAPSAWYRYRAVRR